MVAPVANAAKADGRIMMEKLSNGTETRSLAANGFASNGLESSVRSYCRLFSATFRRAHGSHLWDTSGGEYIDLFAVRAH
jgi:4-aminobutyrate aminotransferase-like enzyme